MLIEMQGLSYILEVLLKIKLKIEQLDELFYTIVNEADEIVLKEIK